MGLANFLPWQAFSYDPHNLPQKYHSSKLSLSHSLSLSLSLFGGTSQVNE
jgi:hypothetical protein